ncbi:DUF2490 domain-containing protein [Algibacter sp. L4_22]|uniref:DUF2490 domain-containing protein n=1 Tax=Algibacter sp. L4_22 TaxID=2942477 RepID=UPI00201B644A|nr:DUF2490 domain-containing protein [Algibacter sp. L4_22]MCL5129844.1 DUF2490 domain-containing protein [Algibacter sp. L4_22]
MKYLLTTLVLILFISNSYSQSSPEDKLGAWYMFDATHRVADKWSIKTGTEFRTFEVFDNMNLLFYYLGANYHLNKKTTLTISYCYVDIDRSYAISGESHLYENRPYEQLSYKQDTFKIPLFHRLRLEHRFLNYKHTHTTLHRLRYRLGTKINLNKTLFLNVKNEVFANLKDEVFTENRFYAALGFNISKTNNIQLGYLNHEINKSNFNRLQLGLFIKTDLRKKTK